MKLKYVVFVFIFSLIIILVACSNNSNNKNISNEFLEAKDKIHSCKQTYDANNLLTITKCYDIEGNILFTLKKSELSEYTDVTEVKDLTELGFNKEDINQFFENFDNACITKVNLFNASLSQSLFLFLNKDKLEETEFCVNLDQTVFNWNYGDSKYRYEINMFKGQPESWILSVSPKSSDLLFIDKYPFLECDNLDLGDRFSGSYKYLKVRTEGNQLMLQSSITSGGQVRYPAELNEDDLNNLLKSFQECNPTT